MLQSKNDNAAIHQYQKVLVDYTYIADIALTAEDIFATTMLGKIGLESLSKMTVVLLVNKRVRDVLEIVYWE